MLYSRMAWDFLGRYYEQCPLPLVFYLLIFFEWLYER